MDKLVDCKYFASRLLGQNKLFDKPGAVIEVDVTRRVSSTCTVFVNNVVKVLDQIEDFDYKLAKNVYSNGFQVGVLAPYDVIFFVCNILDEIWDATAESIDNDTNIDFPRLVDIAKSYITKNTNLLIRKIVKSAQLKQVNFFIRDDIIYLGSGKYLYSKKLSKIKSIKDIPWKKIKNIPSVLITGTNGKTTTTRLTEFICRKSGLKSGYCSSDWVMINGKIISEGDLSGPTGHQLVLSNPKLDVAILEVARGGILKRGVLPNYAVGATVTNISQDHLGHSGIETLNDLAHLKGLVYNSLVDNGVAVVNLDDELVSHLDGQGIKCYLSTKMSEEDISKYLTKKNFVVFIESQNVVLKTKSKRYQIANLVDVPLTVHGLAKYNYENILNAVALSYSLGVSAKDITKGLLKFAVNEKSNYGRWNYFYSKKHGHIVVDLAHNPASLNSVLDVASNFKELFKLTGKFVVMYGVTADRRDTINEVVNIINSYKIDKLVIKEFVSHLRGSQLGEVPTEFYNALVESGYNNANIIHNEMEAVKTILDDAGSDDITILCTHEMIPDVITFIKQNI